MNNNMMPFKKNLAFLIQDPLLHFPRHNSFSLSRGRAGAGSGHLTEVLKARYAPPNGVWLKKLNILPFGSEMKFVF